jgi:hypothetical protein
VHSVAAGAELVLFLRLAQLASAHPSCAQWQETVKARSQQEP